MADRDRLLPLIRDFYAIDGHSFDEARIDGGLLPLLRDDRYGQIWLAETNGTAAGYAVVTWSWSLESGGLDCILDELFVSQRGGGLGGALLARAIDEASDYGAAAMFLETELPNDGARRFYGRHGFAADDSVWMSRDL